jgi:guanylate kinase
MNPNKPVPVTLAPKISPIVLVLSGPSGAGKDAVLNVMKTRSLPVSFIITNTTRPMRPGEADGVHYHFVSKQEFKNLMETHELLEYAEVYGNYYGVPKLPVRQALAEGKDVIIKVDVQGAMAIKKALSDTVLIFLMPPSLDELAKRLNGRRTESAKDLQVRIETARFEIDQLPMFDYCVMSYPNRIQQAIADIDAVIHSEHLRTSSRRFTL